MEPNALTSPVKLPYRVAHFYTIACSRISENTILNDKEEAGADAIYVRLPLQSRTD